MKIEQKWPKELRDHVTHHIVLLDKDRGLLATTRQLKSDMDAVIKELLIEILKPSWHLIVEASLTQKEAKDLLRDKTISDFVFHHEESTRAIKIPGIFEVITKIFTLLGAKREITYTYYFVLTSEAQIKKFIPISTMAYLDSYYIYLPENENIVKEKILNKVSLRDMFNLCEAIIPKWGCAGPLEFNIFSHSIVEDEFKKITDIAFVLPTVRYLSEDEIKLFWRSISTVFF